MKHLFSILFIFFVHFSFGQSIIEDRTPYEEYESSDFYIQMKPGTGFGDVVINKDHSEQLSGYPELKGLFIQGSLTEMKLEFKMLAKSNEEFNRIYRVKTSVGIDLDEIIEQLNQLNYIKFSEKIPLFKLSIVPNDPDYANPSKRWHLDQISSELAWDITQGCSNIKIAIVDDAVMTTHQDLHTKIYLNSGEIAGNGIDDDGNGYIDDVNGFDVADNDPDASPPSTATSSYFSHGTHVAGIAGGASNNGIGSASIGYNSTIIPVKVKSNSSAIPSALTNPMQGVEYAIVIGADIINMSWGSYANSAVNQMVFDQANLQGIICVAAVGNDALPFIAYPANYNGVISVVATDATDDMAVFSNFSDRKHVFAPGTNIWSTEATSTSSYGFKSGTSMATPLTSGLIGLMLCNNSNYSLSDIEYCLYYNSDMIASTVIPGYSIPRINAYQTLMCTLPLINSCVPNGCEMIENGSMETPFYSNLSTYGGVYLGELCGWLDYPSTVDIFPLNVSAPDHFAHLQCNIQQFGEIYEGLVTRHPLNLVPGITYKLEFDYCVMKSVAEPVPDHLDSIAIKLVRNNWTQPAGTATILDSNILLGAILNPSVDYIHPIWTTWIANPTAPNSLFNHYTMTFVAPNAPTMQKLVIHPVSDYPTLGFAGTMGLGIDNVSLKPVTDITGTASNYTPLPNDCITLTATTPATYVYWEPAYLFADPTLAVQNICLDTLPICPGGTIEFTVTAMDTMVGCSSSDTVVLNIQGVDTDPPALNTPVLDNLIYCYTASYITPPTAWDDCDGAIVGIPNVTFPVTSTVTITWTFTDALGNSITQTQLVTIPIIDVSTSVTGSTITAAQTGATYLWFDCVTGLAIAGAINQNFTPLLIGSYAVQITVNGCIDSSACVQRPIINLGNDTTLCLGQILNLDATNNTATYLWQDNSTNPTFMVSLSGQYWVEVNLANGGLNSDTINVFYDSIPPINFGMDDTTICDETTLTLNAFSPNSTYLWQDSSIDSVFIASFPDTYWVEVTNNCGIGSDTIEVFSINCDTPIDESLVLVMPNAFTPNNDGNNDLFIPVKINGIVSAQIFIYNRWGQQLFYSELLMQGWDGSTSKGVEVPNGTYFWIVNYVGIDKNEEILKGHVIVLK